MQCNVHRLFCNTSNCKSFDEAPKTNQNIWLTNKYPEICTKQIVNEILETLELGKQIASNTEKKGKLRKQSFPPFNSR